MKFIKAFPYLFFLVFHFNSTSCYSQNKDTLRHPYLSIGTHHAGICFGKSLIYTGFRFNIFDDFGIRVVKTINGFNAAISSDAQKANGISIGLIYSHDSIGNGLSISGLDNGPEGGAFYWGVRNGIALGGLDVGVKKINGIAFGGLMVEALIANGIFFSGIGIASKKMNGFSLTGGYSGIDTANGVVIGSAIFDTIQNGFSFGLIINKGSKSNGLCIGSIVTIHQVNGVSIGIINKAMELNGVQLGLINYAGNNPKWARYFPFINMHFGKKKAKEKPTK